MRPRKTPNFASGRRTPEDTDRCAGTFCTRLATVCNRVLVHLLPKTSTGALALVAANDQAAGIAPTGCLAANDLQVTSRNDGTGEFFVPFGEYKNVAMDPRTGTKFPCVQVVNQETASKLLVALNSLGGRIVRALGAIPIHIGHPDIPGAASEGKRDTSSYGSVTGAELATREVAGEQKPGIAFNVKFNRRGREIMCDDPPGYFFHSPVWPLEVIGAANGLKRVAPVGLHSFGLTNTPAIPVPMISMNEDMGEGHPEATPAPEPAPEPVPAPPSLLERVIAAIGSAAIQTPDEVVGWVAMAKAALAKINAATEAKWKAEDAVRLAVANEAPVEDRLIALLDDAATGRRTSDETLIATNEQLAQERTTAASALAEERAARVRVETDLADLQARLVAANEATTQAASQRQTAVAAAAKLLIDHAVSTGRVIQGERAHWVIAFNEDFAGAAERLAKQPRLVPTNSLTGDLGGRRPANDPRAQFLVAVNETARAMGGGEFTPRQYDLAWERCKTTHQTLWLAMAGATG